MRLNSKIDKLKVVLLLTDRDEIEALGVTLRSIANTSGPDERAVLVYSKNPISSKYLGIHFTYSDVGLVFKNFKEEDSVLFCYPGVVFEERGWVKEFLTSLDKSPGCAIGAICRVGSTKIRGYSNKNLLNLSPVSSKAAVNVDVIRFVVAVTGGALNRLESAPSSVWDFDISRQISCDISSVNVDVTLVNRKLNLRK